MALLEAEFNPDKDYSIDKVRLNGRSGGSDMEIDLRVIPGLFPNLTFERTAQLPIGRSQGVHYSRVSLTVLGLAEISRGAMIASQ